MPSLSFKRKVLLPGKKDMLACLNLGNPIFTYVLKKMRNTANENTRMFKILGTCITYTLVKQETLSEATHPTPRAHAMLTTPLQTIQTKGAHINTFHP